MKPTDRLTRLEALLERVQGRTLDARELASTTGSPTSEDEALRAAEGLSAEDVTLDAELEPDDAPDAETGWSIPVPRPDADRHTDLCSNDACDHAPHRISETPPDDLASIGSLIWREPNDGRTWISGCGRH